MSDAQAYDSGSRRTRFANEIEDLGQTGFRDDGRVEG